MVSKIERHRTYIERVIWCKKLLDEISPNKKRVGVEVGLWKADFAKSILEADILLNWIGVDPYSVYGKKARGQPDWDAIHTRVANKMIEFEDRFTLIRLPSEQGVELVPDNVDFVFVDANHDYEFVLKDIAVYEKKIRPGGIMAGHDYNTPKDGVRRAVNKYVKEHNRDLKTSIEFDPCGVFWWEIPN